MFAKCESSSRSCAARILRIQIQIHQSGACEAGCETDRFKCSRLIGTQKLSSQYRVPMGATPDLDTRIIDDDVAGDGMGQAIATVSKPP